MKFVDIEVTEILQRVVRVPIDELETGKEAIDKAKKMYFEEKFVLDNKDFVDVSFGQCSYN